MFAPVYCDYNATTPLEPAVLEAMMPWLSQQFGNASSRHEYGRAARRAIDEARSQVAKAIGAHRTEVVFTSGGSEANNLFIKGAAARMKPGLIAVSAIEHPCVIKPAEQLVRRGWQLERLAVDDQGRIDFASFEQALAKGPALISAMLANNETGVLQAIETLATKAQNAGVCFHSDAVQAVGKIAVDFRRLNAAGVDAITVSSHKLGGPKGAAALVIDKRIDLEPLIAGGGQEHGLRSGTENVAAIVGFGVACELAVERMVNTVSRLFSFRGRLEVALNEMGATLFGIAADRLPNTIYFALPDIDGETLVSQLDRAGYAVASGAACSSASPEPSHVLRAMGVAPEMARGAVRISLGAGNSAEQMEGLVVTLQSTVARLRKMTAIAV